MSFILFLLIFLTGICNGQPDEEESFDYVLKECNDKLKNIGSIMQFERFMNHYRVALGSQRPISGKKLQQCYELKEPLQELENLLRARYQEGICRPNYIDRLVEFHFKYISHRKQVDLNTASCKDPRKDPSLPSYSYLAYFFSLYAHQVAYKCKKKLASRIIETQTHYDCSSILSKLMPAVIQPQDLSPQEDQEFSGMIEFLREFKRVEDFVSLESSFAKQQVYIDVIIPDEVVDKIDDLKSMCSVVEPHYIALFSPVSSLAQIGYTVEDSKVDSDDIEDSDTRLLRCWLATAQLCQGILRTHLTVKSGFEVTENSKFVSIKWEAPPKAHESRNEGVKYFDTIDDISPFIVKLVDKKFTFFSKFKRRTMSWFKTFVKKHIDIDAAQRDAVEKFIEMLTDSDNGIDSKVGFAGRKFDDKRFNPVSVITNDVDTVIQCSSTFWNKEVGLIASSIVAVVMSAVFVWFSLYALATALKHHYFGLEDHGNFKAQWRELRDKRVEKMEHKLNRNKPPFKVYKPV